MISEGDKIKLIIKRTMYDGRIEKDVILADLNKAEEEVKVTKEYKETEYNIYDALTETKNYRAIILLGTVYLELVISSIIKQHVSEGKSLTDMNSILKRVSLLWKIKELKNYGICDPELIKKLNRLRKNRNDIAHKLNIKELKIEEKVLGRRDKKDLDFLRTVYFKTYEELIKVLQKISK